MAEESTDLNYHIKNQITNETFKNLSKQFGCTYGSIIGIVLVLMIITALLLKKFKNSNITTFCITSIAWMLIIPVLFYFIFIGFLKYFDDKGELNF